MALAVAERVPPPSQLAADTVGHLQHVSITRLGVGGAGVVRELRAKGVDVHAVRDPGAPTGLMLRSARRGWGAGSGTTAATGRGRGSLRPMWLTS